MMLPITATAPSLRRGSDNMQPDSYLRPTRFIDCDHPAVRAAASAAIGNAKAPRDIALALVHYVCAIPFGFAGGFWSNRASDVLRSQRGYCNTKSTLFVALLRTAGIPARQQFVEIDAQVLHGILNPGTAMVDHSYVEVLLDDVWVATDAYIVDPPLFVAAQRRAIEEGRLLGYGVHATGTNSWDGESASFAQYNILDERPIGTLKWGSFADVGDFYARAQGPHNTLNPLLRAGFGLLAASANARADALRERSVS